jgi:hypothetical protein
MLHTGWKELFMKNIQSKRSNIICTLLFGSFVLSISSAFLPSKETPGMAQTKSLQNPNEASASFSIGLPAQLSADTVTRIAFVTGATSADVNGNLAPQAVQSYILDAAWNQVMLATVKASGSQVNLEIYGQQDGGYLTRFSDHATAWKGWLPRTQSYIVRVVNTGSSAVDYTLSIEIPARIQFAYGAYSGSVTGKGTAAKIISYVLYARSGQTMTATLSSSTSSVYLSIDGFSGNQALLASSAAKTTWTGILPQTQEYIIRAVQNSTWVDFTLTVTIV